MPDSLKIFVSWSGDTSKEVAREIKDLLEHVCDHFVPWMSDKSISSGERGLDQIASSLQGTSVGLVVVTSENQDSPWLNFEAGALSKEVEENSSRVMPILVDLSGSELQGPLSQFQYRVLNREDMTRVVMDLADLANANPLTVQSRLSARWDEFEKKYTRAQSESRHPARQPKRELRDMVEEVLELVRKQSRTRVGLPQGFAFAAEDATQDEETRYVRRLLQKFGYSPDLVRSVDLERGLVAINLRTPEGLKPRDIGAIEQSVRRGLGLKGENVEVQVRFSE